MRKFISALVLAIIIAIVWFAKVQKTPETEPRAAVPSAVPTSSVTASFAAEQLPTTVIPTHQVPKSLEPAVECAKYIGEIRRKLPPERSSSRQLLSGLQATLFINDYAMATKLTGSELVLSKAAVMDAFSSVNDDLTYIRLKLATYADLPGTLADHYSRVRSNEKAAGELQAIERSIVESEAAINPESDMLMDCIRMVYLYTEVDEFYGPKKSPAADFVPIPEEAEACFNSVSNIFRFRFVGKYGLPDATAKTLLTRLTGLKISNLSPADMEIPKKFR